MKMFEMNKKVPTSFSRNCSRSKSTIEHH